MSEIRERMDGFAQVDTLNGQRLERPVLGVKVGECAAYTPYIPTIQKPAGWGAKSTHTKIPQTNNDKETKKAAP